MFGLLTLFSNAPGGPIATTATGGLSLSGTVAIGWGTITGTGGLVVSAQTTTSYPSYVPPLVYVWPQQQWSTSAPSLTVASGGLAVGGSAFAVARTSGQGGLSLSGHAFPSVVTIAAGGLSVSGSTLPLSIATLATGGLSATGSATPTAGKIFGTGGLTASGIAQPAAIGTRGTGGLSASGTAIAVANSTVLAVGGLTLSGTASPGSLITTGTGGLSLIGSAIPTPQVIGSGGLTATAQTSAIPGTVGTGGLAASGTVVPLFLVITQATGGLDLSGSAAPIPATVGSGGFVIGGDCSLCFSRVANGGLTASGTATAFLTTRQVFASGGLSLSGATDFASVARVGMGGLVASGSCPADLPFAYDLIDAIVSQLRATMTGVITVHSGFAGPATPIPYAEIYEVSENRSQMSGLPYLFDGEVQFNVYSYSRLYTRQLGDTISSNIVGKPLKNQVGSLMYLAPMTRLSITDQEPGVGGKTVFQEVRTFTYQASGTNPI